MSNTIQHHYQHHLAAIYSWMLGSFEDRLVETEQLLDRFGLKPEDTDHAIDFGAGNGIMALALAKRGFNVTAVEQNEFLLEEIGANTRCYAVQPTLGDMHKVLKYATPQPELIVCAGDTLSHFEDWAAIERFVADCAAILPPLGRLYLTFRDYITPLEGDARFIPVRQTAGRILTCLLEYETDRVQVTDVLYEKQTDHTWVQSVSSYYKVRLTSEKVMAICDAHRLDLLYQDTVRGMVHLVYIK